MSSPAAARGHEVRQRLLAAAAELIPELGWSAVSTRILADRAGVTPSVVHYHFTSLQLVLQEAALAAMAGVVAEMDAAIDSADSPGALLDSALATAQPFTGSDPMTLLFVEAYLAGTRDATFGERIAQLLADSRTRFARRLADHGAPDPDGTAAVVFAALDGMALHRGLGIGPDSATAGAAMRRLIGDERKGRSR